MQQGEITVDGIVVNDKKTDLAKLRSRVGWCSSILSCSPICRLLKT
ncbi:hypothetical protein [Escherichia coli ISC7]|uniref:Uncharacterized protein n=1 Tax=Escherichia coli ISC7 TaxID=1432555 RepID=W1EQN9_ECOLX|nr:hypothetical protein [Escherichia coli ISC7]